jgi:lipopolysaccharide biosynthesis protein
MQPAPQRIAVICHMFHEDLAGEFRQALDNLPPSADLFVSTDSEKKIPGIKQAFRGWNKGKVEIRAFPNRGRDIGPKLAGFPQVYAQYDVILFLHSKKSLTSSLGNEWRRMLLGTLSGSPQIVDSILMLFESYPDLGCVVPQHFPPIRSLLHWDGNFAQAERLARRMGIPLARHRTIDFPSGSMFWARPAALRPLTGLDLGFADFPPEENQVRGTPQHAIERLFLLVCERAGYRWVKVAAPMADKSGVAVVPIADKPALDLFMARHQFNLLPKPRIRG